MLPILTKSVLLTGQVYEAVNKVTVAVTQTTFHDWDILNGIVTTKALIKTYYDVLTLLSAPLYAFGTYENTCHIFFLCLIFIIRFLNFSKIQYEENFIKPPHITLIIIQTINLLYIVPLVIRFIIFYLLFYS